MVVLTPVSRMKYGVDDEIVVSSAIRDAKTQDLPSLPFLRTQESRLKRGTLGSNFSNVRTVSS